MTLEALEHRITPSFSAPVSYNIGTQADGFVPNAAPINVVSADFNHDGKLDLAVVHRADNSVYMLLGNGNGTFQPALQVPVGENIEGREFVGDFNSDGKLDLFLPSGDLNSCHAIVLLGNGNGTFQSRIDSSSFNVAGTYPRGWAVGDVNGDGKLDVASTLPSNSANSGGYIVLLGNGDGTFQTGVVGPTVLHYSRWMALADFNKDGKLDMATADGQGTSSQPGTVELSILLGKGDGTFGAPTAYPSPQLMDPDDPSATANPEDVTVADLNNDGKLDVIESDYDNTINVFLGNGDGTFQPAHGYEPGHYPRSVTATDVNGDGKVDLVVTDVGINTGGAEFGTEGIEPGAVSVLPGNGDGTFQDAVQYQPFAFPGWTAVGDFDGDGAPDLATTRVFDGHSVSVTLNLPAGKNLPPTPAMDASATPNPGGATRFALNALGADDGGEANLTYTWSVLPTPPGSVTFATNGTNGAKNTSATFSAAGTYNLQVLITDAGGVSAISLVTVTVSASAITDTWTGLGTTGNWSDAANWSNNAVPGAGMTVVFNGTSSKNAVVDAAFAGTVAAVQLNSGYAGTVTLNENLTVGGAFSEQSGTYNANGFATNVAGTTTLGGGTYLASTNAQTLTGGLTVSGGSFTGSTGTVTAGSVTLSVGTLVAPSGTLVVTGGNFTCTGGTFNANQGTVQYTGTNTAPTLSLGTGSVRFYNFQDAMTASYPAGMTVTGTLTVTGAFTWKAGSGPFWGNIEAQGDVDDENHGGTGNPYLTLDGAGDQTIRDNSGGGGGFLRTLTIDKPGGTVFLAANSLVYANFTLTAGAVSTGSFSWLLGGQGPVSAAAGLNMGNVTIGATNVTVGSASLQVANVTFGASTVKFTAPAGNLYVSGSWSDSVGAAFVPNGGTVVFNGPGVVQQLNSGGQAFNNLTIAAGSTVELESNVTVLGAFVNSGTLNLNGFTVFTTPSRPRGGGTDGGGSRRGHGAATQPTLVPPGKHPFARLVDLASDDTSQAGPESQS